MYEILILVGIIYLYLYYNNYKLRKKIKYLKKNYSDKDKLDLEKIKEVSIKYEKFVKNIYEKKGYEVEHRGIVIENGKEVLNKKDAGIDLIATKNGYKTILIQCKYWTSNCKEKLEELRKNKKNLKLKEKDLKGFFVDCKLIQEFLGNCTKYLLSTNDIKNIDDYEFIINIPYIHNLKYNAEKELQDINQKVKLKTIEMLDRYNKQITNKYRLILGIIEAENKCYILKCQKNTPVITLKFYEVDEKDRYFIKKLPEDLLKKIQEKYPQYKYRTMFII